MIGRIRGILVAKQAPMVLVETGGVGYELQLSMHTLCELPDLGSEVILLTHFVVREDAQLLYGFVLHEERQAFRELIKVSGLGPKLALTILSGMRPAELADTIADRNILSLTKLPGVGKKTAERMVLELQDKFKSANAPSVLPGVTTDCKNDAISALIALGYKQAEAQKAINKVFRPELSSELLIRNALQAALK